MRLFSTLDVMLATTLAVEDAGGREILRLHKPWFSRRIEVTRGDGAPVGSIGKQLRLGKARLRLTGPDGAELGQVHAQNWRARDFAILDATGQEVATVTKQWRGLVTEALHGRRHLRRGAGRGGRAAPEPRAGRRPLGGRHHAAEGHVTSSLGAAHGTEAAWPEDRSDPYDAGSWSCWRSRA